MVDTPTKTDALPMILADANLDLARAQFVVSMWERGLLHTREEVAETLSLMAWTDKEAEAEDLRQQIRASVKQELLVKIIEAIHDAKGTDALREQLPGLRHARALLTEVDGT